MSWQATDALCRWPAGCSLVRSSMATCCRAGAAQGITPGRLWDKATTGLLSRDGADHHRLRRLVSTSVHTTVNRTVGGVVAEVQCDLVRDDTIPTGFFPTGSLKLTPASARSSIRTKPARGIVKTDPQVLTIPLVRQRSSPIRMTTMC